MMEENLINMAKQIPQFGPVDHATVMANTRSTIRKRYKLAYWNLRNRVTNIGFRESRVKAFVKYEKIPIGKYEANKPPRLIQFRDFTYLYSLKRQILGYTLAIKKNAGITWGKNHPVQEILTKYHDNYGCARVLYESWCCFSRPVAICLDHNKFDGHFIIDTLKAEHQFWTTMNPSRKFEFLLNQQNEVIGITMNGIRYLFRTCRCSGEATTSDGNSAPNYSMLEIWLICSGITNYRIHVNGDDSVVMIEQDDLSKLLPLDFFAHFNMETECDRIVTDFRQISYCQASPIRVRREGQVVWYMVKEPRRTMSRIQYCDKKFYKPWRRFMVGVGLCELAVNSGVPLMQNFALWMISQEAAPLGCVDKIPAISSGNLSEYRRVDPITRVDYEAAFGIAADTQIQLERAIAGLIRSPTDLNAKLLKYREFIKH